MTRVILEAALVATVTAYAVGDGYTPHHGVTASGARVEAGDTLAADWAYHPAGTRVWLAGVGWRTVTDRGSGIKGPARFDLYLPLRADAIAWGRRRVAYRVAPPVLSTVLYQDGKEASNALPCSPPKNVIYCGPSYPKQVSNLLMSHATLPKTPDLDYIGAGELRVWLSFTPQYPALPANGTACMIPCTTPDNTLNCALPTSKAAGNRHLILSRRIGAPHFQNIAFGESSVRVIFPGKDCLAALSNHIGHIVGIRTKPQMTRIDAIPDIARVTNMKPGRDVTLSSEPREAVRQNLGAADADSPVSVASNVTEPSPAIAVRTVRRIVVNVGPKIFRPKAARKTSVLSKHHHSPFSQNYSRRRAIQAAVAVSVP